MGKKKGFGSPPNGRRRQRNERILRESRDQECREMLPCSFPVELSSADAAVLLRSAGFNSEVSLKALVLVAFSRGVSLADVVALSGLEPAETLECRELYQRYGLAGLSPNVTLGPLSRHRTAKEVRKKTKATRLQHPDFPGTEGTPGEPG